MSQFNVGDVCVTVNANNAFLNPLHFDAEVRVVEVINFFSKRAYVVAPFLNAAFMENELRLKRPKDDAEPRTDFTACDDDFREWLKARQRERV
jgi:hypothetical protein